MSDPHVTTAESRVVTRATSMSMADLLVSAVAAFAVLLNVREADSFGAKPC